MRYGIGAYLGESVDGVTVLSSQGGVAGLMKGRAGRPMFHGDRGWRRRVAVVEEPATVVHRNEDDHMERAALGSQLRSIQRGLRILLFVLRSSHAVAYP